MIDSRKLEDLHPTVERGARELSRRVAEAGLSLLVTSTYRDNEMQDYLYAQGRTRPGAVVTNAKAGHSFHNFRLAFDVCKNQKGAEYSDAAFFKTAGKIWAEMGGVWGGSFATFTDAPHMEFTGGLTAARLRAGETLPEDARMKWESAAPPRPSAQETLQKLSSLITMDTPYWQAALNGKPADPAYLRAIFARAAALAPEDAEADAACAISRLSRLITLDAPYWQAALTGRAPADPAFLRTIFERIAENASPNR